MQVQIYIHFFMSRTSQAFGGQHLLRDRGSLLSRADALGLYSRVGQGRCPLPRARASPVLALVGMRDGIECRCFSVGKTSAQTRVRIIIVTVVVHMWTTKQVIGSVQRVLVLGWQSERASAIRIWIVRQYHEIVSTSELLLHLLPRK